jgi:hypothetical protein
MLCIVTLVVATSGQLVIVDPHACDEVRVQPNLTLSIAAQVDGQLADPSGAPISNTRLELRTYTSEVKQVLFKRAQTDDKGNFSFGMTPAGRYRLVAFAAGFKQAADLKCSDRRNCTLSLRLELAPSDIPCPAT